MDPPPEVERADPLTRSLAITTHAPGVSRAANHGQASWLEIVFGRIRSAIGQMIGSEHPIRTRIARRAREVVRTAVSVDRAAVAWDGYLTADGQRSDAVFVEASEVGDPESLLLAQRYAVSGRLKKRVERVGNAAIAGRAAPLF